MAVIHSGKVEEIIYARLDPGDDLLHALWDVCKERDVRTGVLLDATGSMEKVVLQRWPREERPDRAIDFVEMRGPLEVSAHGLIGQGWAPDGPFPAQPGFPAGFMPAAGFRAHGEPYFHVHLIVSNSESTVCGHLMEGSPIDGRGPGDSGLAHFTVVIAKVSGVLLRATYTGKNFFHDLMAV